MIGPKEYTYRIQSLGSYASRGVFKLIKSIIANMLASRTDFKGTLSSILALLNPSERLARLLGLYLAEALDPGV